MFRLPLSSTSQIESPRSAHALELFYVLKAGYVTRILVSNSVFWPLNDIYAATCDKEYGEALSVAWELTDFSLLPLFFSRISDFPNQH